MKVRKSLGGFRGADRGKRSVSVHPNHLKSLLKSILTFMECLFL